MISNVVASPTPNSDPGRLRRGAQEALRELMSPPRFSRYVRRAASERTPTSNVSVVSTAWVGSGLALNATSRTPSHGSPRSVNTHGLAASRATSNRPRPTAGGRRRSNSLAPRVPEVDRHDDLGPVPTDLGGEVGTQCQSLDDRAVGPPEERHLVHAHDGAARLLLAPPDRTGLGGIHRRDPRFTVRHEDVEELLALPGPSSNGRGRARTPCRRGARPPRVHAPSPREIPRVPCQVNIVTARDHLPVNVAARRSTNDAMPSWKSSVAWTLRSIAGIAAIAAGSSSSSATRALAIV